MSGLPGRRIIPEPGGVLQSVTRPRWRYQWSIDIYSGPTPLALTSASDSGRPAISAEHVTDIPAGSVADPFLIRRDDLWHLFFEVWNNDSDRGEIACSTSRDGFDWDYGRVVLRESFHLSYPQVFAWDGDFYMIPETRQDQSVRLYRAAQWPGEWRYERTLLRGNYADATILRHQNCWWMFAQRGLDECRLFSCDTLEGDWRQHPSSPLWPGNRRRTRPGGRIISWNGRLIRFAQDGLPEYGNCLRAFEIDRLSPAEYDEHELPESPIFRASRSGWNAVAMHHINAVPIPGGGWLAAVDGACPSFY